MPCPLPGSANYIQNATAQQASSNFNISGEGKANIFSASTQYNLGANRILSSGGVIRGKINDFTPVEQDFLGQRQVRSLIVVPVPTFA